MTTAAMILAAVLAIAAVLAVARPFLRRLKDGTDEVQEEEQAGLERLRLLEERDRALAALKELEFDHRTGKISDDDYRRTVSGLRSEAAAVLSALASFDGEAGGIAVEGRDGEAEEANPTPRRPAS
jgi:hypothetical protein